jgi:hypothetical protein
MAEKIWSEKTMSRKKKFEPQQSEDSDFQPSASKQPRIHYESSNLFLSGKMINFI